ncbi:MAG: hypothetical protein ACKN9T_04390 [Candidatus Methylumidiphilus sp.]
MSTKSTIQSVWDEETHSGYHLFFDVMDSFGMEEMEGKEPVYLELNGVEFTASSPGHVEVKIPRAWAVKLGLVPA